MGFTVGSSCFFKLDSHQRSHFWWNLTCSRSFQFVWHHDRKGPQSLLVALDFTPPKSSPYPPLVISISSAIGCMGVLRMKYVLYTKWTRSWDSRVLSQKHPHKNQLVSAYMKGKESGIHTKHLSKPLETIPGCRLLSTASWWLASLEFHFPEATICEVGRRGAGQTPSFPFWLNTEDSQSQVTQNLSASYIADIPCRIDKNLFLA